MMASIVKKLRERLAGVQPGAVSDAENVFHEEHESQQLRKFRLLIGISTNYNSFNQQGVSRPSTNLGLYRRIVKAETVAHTNYKHFSMIINACYFLQIIIAASLTALGAANADNKAITAFGAINTIIAGFLTFLKGSGLPGRLKYYGDEWRKIREHIEQVEREFARADAIITDDRVMDEVTKIWNMYQDTKRDVEMNTPDTYNSVTAHRAPRHDTGSNDTLKTTGPASIMSGEKHGELSEKSSRSDIGLKT